MCLCLFNCELLCLVSPSCVLVHHISPARHVCAANPRAPLCSLSPSSLPLCTYCFTLIVSHQCTSCCVFFLPCLVMIIRVSPLCSHVPRYLSVCLCLHLPQFRVASSLLAVFHSLHSSVLLLLLLEISQFSFVSPFIQQI